VIRKEHRGRGRIYADDWEQASHNGDLVHAVEAEVLDRDDVAELGNVLMGTSQGAAPTATSPCLTQQVSRFRTLRSRWRRWSVPGHPRSTEDRTLSCLDRHGAAVACGGNAGLAEHCGGFGGRGRVTTLLRYAAGVRGWIKVKNHAENGRAY
jgi:hypothetical protein